MQEALTNISRHANATKVQISLVCDDTSINVAIQDDGCGFDMSHTNGRQTPGMGLLGMHERVTLLGGTFEIVSAQGKGTQIGLSIPKSNTHEQN